MEENAYTWDDKFVFYFTWDRGKTLSSMFDRGGQGEGFIWDREKRTILNFNFEQRIGGKVYDQDSTTDSAGSGSQDPPACMVDCGVSATVGGLGSYLRLDTSLGGAEDFPNRKMV